MIVEPDRFWILDPAGHREETRRAQLGRPEKAMTPLGEAVVVGPFYPENNAEWVCDLCSDTILTVWGAEPFPVPMLGSYALCGRHFDEAQEWPHDNDRGEQVPGTRLGDWPPVGCSCHPCVVQLKRMLPFLVNAYDILV